MDDHGTHIETERKFVVRWHGEAVVPAVQELATEVLSIVHIYPPREPNTRYGQLSRDGGEYEYIRTAKTPLEPGSRNETNYPLSPEEWAGLAGMVLRGELPVIVKTRYCWNESGLMWELDVFDHPHAVFDSPTGKQLMLLEVEGVHPEDDIPIPMVFRRLAAERKGLPEYSVEHIETAGLTDVTLEDTFYAVNLATPLTFNTRIPGVNYK